MEIATYKYTRKEGAYPSHQMVGYSMKVEILEDTGRGKIRVKFLGYHADGRPPGTISTVWPKSLKRNDRTVLVSVASRSGKTIDLKDYLENLDPELIRKPYKDD